MSRALKRSERRGNDAYFTPFQLARSLVQLLPLDRHERVLEPHAGGGAFVRALQPRVRSVMAWDVDRTLGWIVQDFLAPHPEGPAPDWIVGNPPYDQAEDHVRRALETSRRHVAFLLRLAFMESRKRLPFWQQHPARFVWVLAQRPSFERRARTDNRRQATLFTAQAEAKAQLSDGGTDSSAYGFFWWDKTYAGMSGWKVISWQD